MSNGIIENAEELKSLYLQTDITNVAVVQSAIKEVSENVYVAGKEKYLEALNSATPANISKARKYNKMASANGIKSLILKNLGWIIMAIFFILAMMFDNSGLFEESTVTWPYIGIWIGIGVQIYITVLKSAWKKITLSGSVIHPVLTSESSAAPTANVKFTTSQTPAQPQQSASMEKDVFCSECGRKNKENAQYCENCGAKL